MIRQVLLATIVSLWGFSMNDAVSQSDKKIVEIATKEVLRRNLNVSADRASVVAREGKYVVVFTDAQIPPGARGVRTSNPTLEVEVEQATLKVIRSYFAR